MFINRYDIEEKNFSSYIWGAIETEEEMNQYFELATKASSQIPFYNPTVFRKTSFSKRQKSKIYLIVGFLFLLHILYW